MRFFIAALLLGSVSFGLTARADDGAKPVHVFKYLNTSKAGDEYSTADFKSKNAVFVYEMIMNFCPACNENAFAVDRLYKEYKKDSRVQVLTIMLDSDQAEIDDWQSRHSSKGTLLQDFNKVYKTLGVAFIPKTFIFDCNMNMVLDLTPGMWDEAAEQSIRDTIDTTLKNQTCDETGTNSAVKNSKK